MKAMTIAANHTLHGSQTHRRTDWLVRQTEDVGGPQVFDEETGFRKLLLAFDLMITWGVETTS